MVVSACATPSAYGTVNPSVTSMRAIANCVIFIFFIYLSPLRIFAEPIPRSHFAYQTQPSGQSNHLLIGLRFNRMKAKLLRLVVYEVRDAQPFSRPNTLFSEHRQSRVSRATHVPRIEARKNRNL